MRRTVQSFPGRHWFCLLVLVVAPIVWWWPLLAGQLPDFMDTVTQLYPMRMAAARQIHGGVPPLWLPNIFCGVPLAANPQISVWYPPQWIFYLAPNPIGNGLVVLFHYVCGGLGVYILTCRLAPSRVAGLFAAFSFQFGSMMVSRIALTPHLYTAAWVPWMILAVENSLAHRGWRPARGTVFFSLILALQILAGSPQITFYTGLVVGLYWIIRGMQTGGGPMSVRVARTILQGVYAVALAVMLSGIQLLPTLEFLRECERSTLPVETIQIQGLHGSLMWRALVGYTGDPIEHTDTINAIGIGGLLLIPIALMRGRNRRVAWALVAGGMLAFLLSLSVLVPLWSRVLPMYQSFHSPRRALLLWSVLGPIAAGLGAFQMVSYIRLRGWPATFPALVMVVLSIPLFWMLPRLDRVFTGEERFQPDADYIRVIGDDRFLAVDPTMNYPYDSRRPDYGLSMMPDLACWFDYNDPQGYDPLVPRRYGMVRRLVSFQTGFLYPSHGAFLTNPGSSALRMLNVQYLVGSYERFDPARILTQVSFDPAVMEGRVELVKDHARWPLYRYTEKRPLAWSVPVVRHEPSGAQALSNLAIENPYEVAYTELSLTIPGEPDPPGVAARYVDARTLGIKLDRASRATTFVCVSMNWMPGWTVVAPADAPEVLLTVANGWQIGLVVPPGVQSFEIQYRPASVRHGLVMTLFGILLSLLCLYINDKSLRGIAGRDSDE